MLGILVVVVLVGFRGGFEGFACGGLICDFWCGWFDLVWQWFCGFGYRFGLVCIGVVGFRVVVCFAVHLVSSGLAFAVVLV